MPTSDSSGREGRPVQDQTLNGRPSTPPGSPVVRFPNEPPPQHEENQEPSSTLSRGEVAPSPLARTFFQRQHEDNSRTYVTSLNEHSSGQAIVSQSRWSPPRGPEYQHRPETGPEQLTAIRIRPQSPIQEAYFRSVEHEERGPSEPCSSIGVSDLQWQSASWTLQHDPSRTLLDLCPIPPGFSGAPELEPAEYRVSSYTIGYENSRTFGQAEHPLPEPTQDQWEAYRDIIIDLYNRQPLDTVMAYMRHLWNFDATPSAYTSHLAGWGFMGSLKINGMSTNMMRPRAPRSSLDPAQHHPARRIRRQVDLPVRRARRIYHKQPVLPERRSATIESSHACKTRSPMLLSASSAQESTTMDHPRSLPRVLKSSASRLLLDYRSNLKQRNPGPDNNSHTETPAVSQTPINTSSLSQSQPRGSKKRSTSQENEDDSNGGASGRRPSKKQKVTNTKLFCCPFWKLRPAEHRPCFKYILRRIRDVKQHLHRKHTPSYYCERCSEIFPDDTKLREHISHPAGLFCTPSSSLQGVSRNQRLQLARHSDKELSEEDQWFSIWNILFPGYQRPKSAYMDCEVSEDIHLFRDFCRDHGEAILAEEIETAGLSESVKGNEKQLFSTVFAQAMNTLFDDWVSGRKGSRHTTSNDCQSRSGTIVPGESQGSLALAQDLSGNWTTSHGVEAETNPVLPPDHREERPLVNDQQFSFETADWGDLSTTFMFSSNGEADMQLPSIFGGLIENS